MGTDERTRRRRRLGLAAATLAAALICVAPQALAGKFHGVVAQGDLEAADYELMAAGGAGTLRIAVRWRAIQPALATPPEEWNWESTDAVAAGAAANGLQVLPVLDAPSPSGVADPPTTAAARAAFASFAGEVAARYGPGGSYWTENPGPAAPFTVFQIYNEQNGRAHWRANPNPRAYGKILRAASGAIDQEIKNPEIVLGGMFVTPSGRRPITSWRFLDRLYGMNGIKRDFDTVAVHPYSESLRGIKFQVSKLRGVMVKNRDRGAKLRITEFGWGSANRGHLNLGRKGQARMLKKAFRLFRQKKREWNLRGVNWFSFQDDPGGVCSFCKTSGLVEADRDPKPSWRAFKRIAK